MKRFAMTLLIALFAATCRDDASSGGSGADTDTGTGTDTGTSTDTDTDTDTDADGCECDSQDDNYCADNCTLVVCMSNCFFHEHECCGDGCFFCDEDVPECVCDCGWAECSSEADSYCVDGSTLMECVDPGWYGECPYYQSASCYDPATCPGGSGCTEEGPIADCWCDTDAGVDGGADGGG